MKNFLLTLITLLCFSPIFSQESEITTYYLIRHAEKVRTDKNNKNPNLTEKGLQRAKHWKTVFQDVEFDVIYSTKYNRTIQTAEPTANAHQLSILNYNPSKLFNAEFQNKTQGKTVLIVGHSNTTPLFVNTILGTNKYTDIDDKNNANLYIVTISNDKKSDILLKIPFQ